MLVAHNQRQLRPAEDQPVDTVAFFHSFRNREQTLARLREENIVQQLTKIFFVNENLLFVIWHDEIQPGGGKYVRVKLGLHREARAEQAGTFQPE